MVASLVQHLILKDFPSLGGTNLDKLLDSLCYNQHLQDVTIVSYQNKPWNSALSTAWSVTKAMIGNRTLEELELPFNAAKSLPVFQAMPLTCSMRKLRLTRDGSIPRLGRLPYPLVEFLVNLPKGKSWHVFMTRVPHSTIGVDWIGVQGHQALDE